ncbi:MAG: glycosyltransferase family 4 protein [Phycisphaerae bacterium]
MRITFLVPGRGFTGGVNVMGEYAGRLHGRGHEVTVLYRRPADAFQRLRQWWTRRRSPDALDESGCDLTPVGAFTPATVPDGDAVVATGPETVRAAGALGPEKGCLVHLVQTLVPLDEDRAAAREIMALDACRVAVSDYVAGCLRDRFGVEAAVVPNGVNHSRFYPGNRPARQPAAVGMMYTPRTGEANDEGFEAVQKVRDTRPDVRLLVFGATKPRGAPPGSEVFIQPKRSRLRGIYAACDAWLAPSRIEGFGQPVLEAMACRAVPVAARAGGHPALVEDEVSGFLVPPGDVEAMARRIGLLFDDESLLRRMALAAHQRSLQFDWETSTDRLEALLAEWVGT